MIHEIEKGCGGEGAQAWGSPRVEFQETKEEEEGVFSFFLVYLMAEKGGLSVQRLHISQGFVWGAVGGAHLAELPSYRQGVQRGSRSRPAPRGLCPGARG